MWLIEPDYIERAAIKLGLTREQYLAQLAADVERRCAAAAYDFEQVAAAGAAKKVSSSRARAVTHHPTP